MIADNSQSMSVSWSPYGKILTNTKAGGASLAFGYNAMQQRVVKRVVLAGDTTRTYYIRDADDIQSCQIILNMVLYLFVGMQYS